jgi:hypothetical protein
MELSNANADPESLLNALHAERESAAEELKRKAEQDEDDAMVAQYFAKIPTTTAGNGKGKGKEKAVPEDGEGSDANSDSDEAALLAERAKANGAPEPPVIAAGSVPNPAQAKRKREGMQKLLGIKKKK